MHTYVSPEFIKSDMVTFLPLLESLFSNILNTRDYPNKWVQGATTPIHKNVNHAQRTIGELLLCEP